MFDCSLRSPTRVDLAGGTLDFWPIFLMLKDPVTINVAIDIFTYCRIKQRADQRIVIHSEDLNIKKEYTNIQDLLKDSDESLGLIKSQIEYYHKFHSLKVGFDIETKSESPVGGGLGGSSSLCISIIKCFNEMLDVKMNTYEMVELAHNLEAKVLKKMTGTQDYFPAILGDVNIIDYTPKGPAVRKLSVPQKLFDSKFILVYTGRSHHSGINNWHVLKEFLDGNASIIKSFERLNSIAHQVVEVFENKKWTELPKLFREEFKARCELSLEFSSPEIEELSKVAERHKAIAKICGAGGGGCVLLWCEDDNKEEVIRAIQEEQTTNPLLSQIRVLSTQAFSNEPI